MNIDLTSLVSVVTLANGLIGVLAILIVPYVLGFIWNKVHGVKYTDYLNTGWVVLLVLGIVFFVLYAVGEVMESLNIALF